MKTILAVHGVGDPHPGEIIKELGKLFPGVATKGLIVTPAAPGKDAWVAPTLECSGVRLVEFNWSDVQRPVASPAGLLRYSLRLVVAMLEVAERWEGRASRALIRILRWWFGGVLIWAPLAPMSVCLLACGDESVRSLVGVLAMLGLLGSYLLSRTRERWMRPLWLGMAVSSAVGLSFWASLAFDQGCASPRVPQGQIERWTLRSAHPYVLGQVGACLICVAVAAAVLLSGPRSLDQRLAHLALTYLPILWVAVVVPLAWVGVLHLVSAPGPSPAYREWQDAYVRSLRYDLASAERLMASAVLLIGALCFLTGSDTTGTGGRL